jgi:hypothetical protein
MTTRITALFLGAVAIAWFVGPAWAQAVAPPAQSSAPAPVGTGLQAIQQSADPSAAIAAYADASAGDHSSGKPEAVFVNKMVDFGMPEMAFHQAEIVANLDPANGRAWAVLAYVSAKRNQMPTALSDVAQAAQRTAGDAFVQRTAGELLAWYDLNFTTVTIPDALKVSLDAVRKQMADQKPFAEAYQQAKDALSQSQQAEAGTTEPPPPAPPAEQYVYSTVPGGYEYPPGTNVYATDYYAYSNPWLTCEPAYYNNWWQPYGFFWGPSFVFFGGGDFHHHGDFDHDGRGSALWHNSATASARAALARGRGTANVSSAVAGARSAAVTGGGVGQHASSLWAGGHVNGAGAGTGAAPLFRSGEAANGWHAGNNVVNSTGRTWTASTVRAPVTSFASSGRTFQTYRPAVSNWGSINSGAARMATPRFSGGAVAAPRVSGFSGGGGFRGGGMAVPRSSGFSSGGFSGGGGFHGGGGGFHGGGGGGHGGGHR